MCLRQDLCFACHPVACSITVKQLKHSLVDIYSLYHSLYDTFQSVFIYCLHVLLKMKNSFSNCIYFCRLGMPILVMPYALFWHVFRHFGHRQVHIFSAGCTAHSSSKCAHLTATEMPKRLVTKKPTKTKLRGLSPQANYTDRATVACRRS
jgi:hypothetical protein